MVNEIISGVKSALVAEFGEDDYDILTEAPAGQTRCDGEVKPCLFVTNRIPRGGSVRERRFSNRQLLGNRYLRTAGLCVEYRSAAVRLNPSPKGSRGASQTAGSPCRAEGKGRPPRLPGVQSENNAVLERLFLCLEYITLEDGTVVRGESMQGEYDENTLNFFVSYDVFVYITEGKTDLMGTLEYNNNYDL
jgi:hypothetical protein